MKSIIGSKHFGLADLASSCTVVDVTTQFVVLQPDAHQESRKKTIRIMKSLGLEICPSHTDQLHQPRRSLSSGCTVDSFFSIMLLDFFF